MSKTGSRSKIPAEPSRPPSTGSLPSARVHSLPPFDPTVARPSKKPVPTAPLKAPRPILASDCLVDDAAPLEPYARSGKVVLTVASLGVIAPVVYLAIVKAAAPALFGVGAAGVLGLAAAFPRRYALRATLATTAAIVAVAATILLGPILALRVAAPMILSASLLLRATYRDNGAVRVALGIGVLAYAAAATFAGGASIFGSAVGLAPRVVAGSMGLAAALSLLGFMGEETTAGSTAWSVLALLAGAAGLLCQNLQLSGLVANAPFAAVLPIGTLGGAMLVGAQLGPRFRRLARERSTIRPVEPPVVSEP